MKSKKDQLEKLGNYDATSVWWLKHVKTCNSYGWEPSECSWELVDNGDRTVISLVAQHAKPRTLQEGSWKDVVQMQLITGMCCSRYHNCCEKSHPSYSLVLLQQKCFLSTKLRDKLYGVTVPFCLSHPMGWSGHARTCKTLSWADCEERGCSVQITWISCLNYLEAAFQI